jgi:hypothetical protein
MNDESLSQQQSNGPQWAQDLADAWSAALSPGLDGPCSPATRDALREAVAGGPPAAVDALRALGWAGAAPTDPQTLIDVLRGELLRWPIREALAAEAGAMALDDGPLAGLLRDAVRAESGALVDDRGVAAAAIAAEAGQIELADAVLAELGLSDAGVGMALREGSRFDAADDVLRLLGLDAGPHVAAAVAAEAGAVDLAGAVFEAISTPDIDVGEALAAEAGTVDLWSRIASATDLAPQVDDAALFEVPAPANIPSGRPARGWFAAFAAVAAVVVGWVVAPGVQPGGAPPVDGAGFAKVEFADAAEFVVNDLQYAADADVQVMMSDDGGAQIIWVDEGV